MTWKKMAGSATAAFVAGCALRVAVVVAVGHYRHPITWENGTIAANLYEGKGFSISFSRPDEPTSWQAPGYPFLLFGLYRAFGKTEATYLFLSLLQAVLISTIVYPLGWITERWFGARAAGLSRWIVCLMPLYGWYPTRIHQPALVMTFHPWLLAGWLKLSRAPRPGFAAGLGIAGGLAALFQPVLLAFLALCGLLLTAHAAREREGRAPRLRSAVIWLAAAVVVLTPWTVRNYAVHGRFVPIKDSLGKEFWMGNNPHATGSPMAEGGNEEITNAFPPQSYALRGRVAEADLMAALLREALDYCRAQPGAFVLRTAKKILWLWTAVPPRLLRTAGEGEAVRFWWLHVTYWTGMVLLAGASLWGARRWPTEYGLVLAACGVLYSAVYGLTIVGNARFRGEIEYLFIPAVSSGLLWVVDRLRGKDRSPRLPARPHLPGSLPCA
jgi:hypothetical protein